MAIIENLDINLRGNTSNLDKSIDGAAAKLGKFKATVQNVGSGVQSGIGRVSAQIGGMFSAIKAGAIGPIAALLSLSAVIAGTGARATEIKALSREASILGLTFNTLSTMASLSGTDAETAAHGIQHMLRSIDEAKEGGKEAIETWRRLGISIADLQSGTTEDKMRKLADGLSKINDEGTRVALAVKVMGRTGAEMLPFLAKGADGVTEALRRADEMGLTLTDNQLAEVKGANDAWRDMKATVTGVFTQLSSILAPAWRQFAEGLTSGLKVIVSWLKENEQRVRTWALAFVFGFQNIGPIIELVRLKIALFAVETFNSFTDLFTRKIPTIFRVFGEGLGNFFSQLASNIGYNFGEIWEAIRSGRKPELVWLPLTEGFDRAMGRIRNMAPREIGAIELDLQRQVAERERQLGRDFDRFLNQRLGAGTNAAGQAGANMVKAADKLAAVERGSLADFQIINGAQGDKMYAVANRQLQESQKLRAEMARLVALVGAGQPLVRARV